MGISSSERGRSVWMLRAMGGALPALLGLMTAASGSLGGCKGNDEPSMGAPSPVVAARCSRDGGDAERPRCDEWVKVEPEGTTCSDGSPYKFFVNYSDRSDDLVVMFEPGGACFDFASCTGMARGAANPRGLPDDHVARYSSLNLIQRNDANPVRDWNMVFVSYCTGDVHAGERVASYPDPAGGPPLEYRHVGAANTRAVIEFLKEHFDHVPRMLVTGCSAGGAGAIENYALIRDALPGVQRGYLLDDSGPIFHSTGPSKLLHTVIRELWNLDPMLARLESSLNLEPGALTADFGRLNSGLAERFPDDRFALTAYQKDLNFSLYSYEAFFNIESADDIHEKWMTDLRDLVRTYDMHPNLGYYIPHFRPDNCSHCSSLAPLGHDLETRMQEPWLGSEIAEDGLDLRQYVEQLLGDEPVGRYFEQADTGTFTPEQSAMCFSPD